MRMGAAREHDRYLGLDGMRGLAAVSVLLHHVVPRTTGVDVFHSGYLAVDFFFMLSGLVIARAWEDRLLGGATLRRFAIARWRRVYPVMAVGVLLGAAVAFAAGKAPAPVAWQTLAQLLLCPTLKGMGAIFPLDGVEWSLFFELVANGIYATVLFRLSSHRLALIAAASLLLFAWLSDPVSGVAMGDRGINIVGGLPRVMTSYVIGVLLHRWLRSGRVRLPAPPYPLLLLILAAALIVPGMIGPELGAGVIDLATVALVFPALILSTCAVRVTPGGARWAEIGAALSYPLYAIHIPVLDGVATLRPDLVGPAAAACVISVALAGALALAMATRTRAASTGPALPRLAPRQA